MPGSVILLLQSKTLTQATFPVPNLFSPHCFSFHCPSLYFSETADSLFNVSLTTTNEEIIYSHSLFISHPEARSKQLPRHLFTLNAVQTQQQCCLINHSTGLLKFPHSSRPIPRKTEEFSK